MITKRVERILPNLPDDWQSGYENVTICATIENQIEVERRLPIYMELPIRHKELICEPLLEDIDLTLWLDERIEQVTAGGESGDEARICDYAWILHLREQCLNKKIPFYFKQTGARFVKDLSLIHIFFEPTGKVEYYYDGVKDDEATETLTDLHTGDTVTAYPDKSKDGMYEVDKTDGLPMIVDDDYTKNVIKVYYKKKKTAVTVQYFYDGIEDKEAAYTINDLAVGSHYDTYKDKKKEHYSLATVTIPEKLVENAEENVIKVYYTRNKTIAKIQYYYCLLYTSRCV